MKGLNELISDGEQSKIFEKEPVRDLRGERWRKVNDNGE